MNFTLTQQVRVLTGVGCRQQLGELLKEAGYQKAFIVTTAGIVSEAFAGFTPVPVTKEAAITLLKEAFEA